MELSKFNDIDKYKFYECLDKALEGGGKGSLTVFFEKGKIATMSSNTVDWGVNPNDLVSDILMTLDFSNVLYTTAKIKAVNSLTELMAEAFNLPLKLEVTFADGKKIVPAGKAKKKLTTKE